MSRSFMLYNRLYNESCLDTMRRFPDNMIDIVITSPPYNMNLRIRNKKYCSRQIVEEFSTKYNDFSDNLPIDEFYEMHKKILKELLRVSPIIFYNIAIVTGSKRAFFKLIGDFADYLKDIIIWDKGYGQPAMQSEVLNRQSELILVFDKYNGISRQFSVANFKRGTLSDVWNIPRAAANKEHKATFPPDLVNTIINNFSSPYDIIYDPFMGTGTTIVQSIKNNRQYAGSEISEQYFSMAQRRIMEII